MKFNRCNISSLNKFPWLKNVSKYWLTENYDVLYEKIVDDLGREVEHIMITQIDYGVVKSWMDMQEIKNYVLGEEAIAIEVFPSSEQLRNGSNTRHLWSWKGIEVPNLNAILKRTDNEVIKKE